MSGKAEEADAKACGSHIIYGKDTRLFCVFIRSVLKEKYLNGSYEKEDDSLQRTIWLASKLFDINDSLIFERDNVAGYFSDQKDKRSVHQLCVNLQQHFLCFLGTYPIGARGQLLPGITSSKPDVFIRVFFLPCEEAAAKPVDFPVQRIAAKHRQPINIVGLEKFKQVLFRFFGKGCP